MAALASQREQKIKALANRVLNQVRPEIAARLQARTAHCGKEAARDREMRNVLVAHDLTLRAILAC